VPPTLNAIDLSSPTRISSDLGVIGRHCWNRAVPLRRALRYLLAGRTSRLERIGRSQEFVTKKVCPLAPGDRSRARADALVFRRLLNSGVRRLDVAVDEPRRMGRAECLANLPQQVDDPPRRQGAVAVAQVFQAQARQVLHDVAATWPPFPPEKSIKGSDAILRGTSIGGNDVEMRNG
jgi:hypothetical protein